MGCVSEILTPKTACTVKTAAGPKCSLGVSHRRGAVPLTPTQSSDGMKEQLNASEGAVKSKSTKTAELPASAVKRRSSKTPQRAVSVLW